MLKLYDVVLDKKSGKEAVIIYESVSDDGLEVVYLLEPVDNMTEPYWCDDDDVVKIS